MIYKICFSHIMKKTFPDNKELHIQFRKNVIKSFLKEETLLSWMQKSNPLVRQAKRQVLWDLIVGLLHPLVYRSFPNIFRKTLIQ